MAKTLSRQAMEARPNQEQQGRVARNTTFLTIALIGQKVLSFLYVLILGRLVGVSSVGDYFSSLSFIGLFAVFIDLGLTPAFIRQTARDRNQGENDLRSIMALKIVTSVIVSVAMLGVIQLLINVGRFSTDVVFLRLAALIMVMDSFVITLYGYLRGIQRLEYESLGIIIHRVTIMIVGITSLTLGAKPIWSMIALLSGSVASLMYVGTQIWKRRINWHPNWHWAPIKRLLKIALPFAIAALFIAIYSTSDNILLQVFGGRRSVGLYGTAAKIISAFNQIFPAALVAAIFPAMSASFIQDRQKLQKIFADSMSYLMVVCVPLMVVLLLLARPIMLAGWGNVWVDAAWPLRILAIGIPFLFLNYPVGYLLNAANLQTKNTINIAITVVVNIGANILFINQYSYHSVAIISVASSAMLFFLGAWRIREVIAIPYRQLMMVLTKTLATGAVMALVGWRLLPYVHRGPSAVVVGGILGLIYLAAMMAMKLIKLSQLTQILQRFRRT